MKKSLTAALLLATLVAPSGPFTPPASASSHREALAVLNEPCADNTDTYAWVSDGSHNKLYLIMNFLEVAQASVQRSHGLLGGGEPYL